MQKLPNYNSRTGMSMNTINLTITECTVLSMVTVNLIHISIIIISVNI